MDIKEFISEWLAFSDAYDTDGYVDMYHKDAVLDDPSVGQKFVGHAGIRRYFETYFIGYKTQTRLVNLDIINDDSARIEVEFTGEFPGGKLGGTFNFIFKDGKIAFVEADLIQ